MHLRIYIILSYVSYKCLHSKYFYTYYSSTRSKAHIDLLSRRQKKTGKIIFFRRTHFAYKYAISKVDMYFTKQKPVTFFIDLLHEI